MNQKEIDWIKYGIDPYAEDPCRGEDMKKLFLVDVPGVPQSYATSEEEAERTRKVLLTRKCFVDRYVASKGWDRGHLSLDQLFEIRSQPEWKNAAGDERGSGG
jgi:hypothetical protein